MTTSIAPRLPDPAAPMHLDPFESVFARFDAVARARPAQLATVWGDTRWTYGHLRRAVFALAGELAQHGVDPGTRVAVTGVRSPGLVTAILAVLARGAVLVPLDPQLPAVRVRRMLELGNVRVVLTAAGDAGGALDLEGLDIIGFTLPLVPPETPDWDAAAFDAPAVAGDDPAYLVFTSGTTGDPKGIIGRHRGLSHFLEWERGATGLGPDDGVAQLTGLSFDVVLRDLFLPLTSGATLHLPPFVPGETPPGELLRWLDASAVTLVHAVPTLVGFWLADVPDDVHLRALRWILFAGEPLHGSLVRRWRERFPGARVANLYGPTETTLAICFLEVPPEPDPGVQPVGTAIPGTQALVMDASRLCAPGEFGEIVIRSPYRSLGYLDGAGSDRPAFGANPWSDAPGDLLYRTGDRGRYRADGILEIHGRLDDQVKIRGVRVEPQEVAATVARHPRVRTCAVLAADDERGETALVAYVVPDTPPLDTVELRAFLTERLVSAQIPRSFMLVESLPRTPNGKLDRRALPPPDWRAAETPAVGAHGDADEEDIEDRVASIWAEVLGERPHTPRTSFLEAGGHSLLAVRFITQIKAAFELDIPLPAFFADPTLAGTVERVRAARAASGPTNTIPGVSSPRRGPAAAPPITARRPRA